MNLVIAVSERHFEHWCREIGLPTQFVRYIYSPNQLRGLLGRADIDILTLPEWWREKSTSIVDEFNELIEEHWKRRNKL
jgi:hypothetical protein